MLTLWGGIVRGSVEVDTYLSTISYSNYKMSCILPVCSVVITIVSVQHQKKLNRMPILQVWITIIALIGNVLDSFSSSGKFIYLVLWI